MPTHLLAEEMPALPIVCQLILVFCLSETVMVEEVLELTVCKGDLSFIKYLVGTKQKLDVGGKLVLTKAFITSEALMSQISGLSLED